jgi:transcriptional regulator with PAS, ATPase and Fis domain
MQLTFSQQKDVILELLNKIVSICKDIETAPKELLNLGFTQFEDNYTAWLNPFGGFKFKAFVYFYDNQFDVGHINELINTFSKNYPKDSKEKSDKFKTVLKVAPKLSDKNAKEKALSLGCKENVRKEVDALIESIATCENTAIKAAYNERLDYMKDVLSIANTLDYEVELNTALQAIGTIRVLEYINYNLRQILDVHKQFNFEVTDKETATMLVYSHYFKYVRSKETVIAYNEKQIDSICETAKKFLKKNGMVRKLNSKEQSERNMLIYRIEKIKNEIEFIKDVKVIE